MKKWFLLGIMLIGFTLANAQTNKPNISLAQDILTLKETSYDFGKILQGRPVTHIFELTNTGKEPLKLNNVQASCGCTTPEWNKDPIMPGATSTIKVGYNAAAEGNFEKTITIHYNENQTKTLTIKGIVYRAVPSSVPENASIKLLKQ